VKPTADRPVSARVARHRVFLYGSLLPGESKHRVLRGATWLADTTTRPLFRLFDLGPYPALLEGGTTAVRGAVFAVDDRLLARLDRFEDHPHLYCRRTLPLANGEEAFGYVFVDAAHASAMPLVVAGCWRTHRRRLLAEPSTPIKT
jgi:gamma-glutamylaminecyclotransferase